MGDDEWCVVSRSGSTSSVKSLSDLRDSLS